MYTYSRAEVSVAVMSEYTHIFLFSPCIPHVKMTHQHIPRFSDPDLNDSRHKHAYPSYRESHECPHFQSCRDTLVYILCFIYGLKIMPLSLLTLPLTILVSAGFQFCLFSGDQSCLCAVCPPT